MYLPDHIDSIGVFDSGVGGLSVANAISERLPGASLLYVADNAYAPYGPRPAEWIRERSMRLAEWLLGRGCRLIVVACNTATAVAIDELRARFPAVPFVGLEPAVKPAARHRRVGVMATWATLASARYRSLRERFLAGREAIWESECAGLVPLIETLPAGHPELVVYLRELFAAAPPLDALVLGCTHYPLIAGDIAAAVGEATELIDPSPAAARQVGRLLTKVGGAAGASIDPGGGLYDFYSTGRGVALAGRLAGMPDLLRGRRWLVPGIDLG